MRRYRVYFNRKSEAPTVWSIDEGVQTSEINVKEFRIGVDCHTRSVWNGTAPNNDTPSAWMVVTCTRMTIEDGIALFF